MAPFCDTAGHSVRLIPLSPVSLGCPAETVGHVESERSRSTTGRAQPRQAQEHHRRPRLPGGETGRYACCTVTLVAFLTHGILLALLHTPLPLNHPGPVKVCGLCTNYDLHCALVTFFIELVHSRGLVLHQNSTYLVTAMKKKCFHS